jgi:hypothetical protein
VSQCSNLPNDVTSATVAVCNLIKSHPVHAQPELFHNLATLLGSDLDAINVCIESGQQSASAMKMLLQAISRTESRHPRDPSATATILLNLCHSSCRDVSTSMLLGVAAINKTMTNPSKLFPRFCTNPAIALLWQHANNSPRECFDSMIANLNDDACHELFGDGVTPCVLRSLLPAYVALCDQRTIDCEESMIAIPEHQLTACLSVKDGNGMCDPQCAALISQLSSGQQCFERTAAVREALAQISNSTCSDSGKQETTIQLCMSCLDVYLSYVAFLSLYCP